MVDKVVPKPNPEQAPVDGTGCPDDMPIGYVDAQGDTIDGADGLDDLIYGYGGNDTIDAGLGQDFVYGGTGDDDINGNDGDDVLYGGDPEGEADEDVEFAVPAIDIEEPETCDDDHPPVDLTDNDTLTGGDGNDYLFGGEGTDTLYGGDGNDSAYGGEGDDIIDTSGLSPLPDIGYPGLYPGDSDPTNDLDFVDGGAGDDTITTGDDDDSIIGGTGNDNINAGFDDDTIDGGEGDDYIVGGEGSDLIYGGDDDDTIYGGLSLIFPDAVNITDDIDLAPNNGIDLVYGGEGNDTIFGQDDTDELHGDEGDDYLNGGIDNDTLYGGAGSDTLIGGQGEDEQYGGDDADNFTVSGPSGGDGDAIDGGTGGNDHDTLTLAGVGDYQIVGETVDADGDSTSGIIQFLDAPGGSVTGEMEFSEIENIVVVPCFTPGSMITTMRGEIPVQELTVGDRVITRDNGAQEIRWMGTKQLSVLELRDKEHLRPVRIRAGSLGRGLPERDMLVSPNHRVLVTRPEVSLYFSEPEVLVPAKHLVNQTEGITQVAANGIDYIHFMFDNHEVVLSDGSWTESFQPGDMALKGVGLDQQKEIFELFPELMNSDGRRAYSLARQSLKKHEAKLLFNAE